MLEFTYMFGSHKTLGGKWLSALIWGHLPAEWVPWYRPPAGFLTLPRCNLEIYPPDWRAQPSRKQRGESAIWLPKSLGSSVDGNTFELFSRRCEASFSVSQDALMVSSVYCPSCLASGSGFFWFFFSPQVAYFCPRIFLFIYCHAYSRGDRTETRTLERVAGWLEQTWPLGTAGI